MTAAGLERNGHGGGGLPTHPPGSERPVPAYPASEYAEYPISGLERLFSCGWTQHVRPDVTSPRIQRVIPDNCADFIVRSDGTGVLVGPATGVDLPVLAPGTRLRGLRIRPGTLRAVTGYRGAELRDRVVPITELLPGRASELLIEAIWDWPRGERFLAEVWRDVTREPSRAETAVAALSRDNGVPVTDVAEAHGLSPRQFRRLVEDEAGLNPATIRAVARLHRFLRIAEGGPPGRPDLAGGAILAGYADQPHMSREVRKLTGLTPARLLAERRTP